MSKWAQCCSTSDTVTQPCILNCRWLFWDCTQYWMTRFQSPVSTRCQECNSTLNIKFTLESLSPLIVLGVSGAGSVRPDLVLHVKIHHQPKPHTYHLRGIGYSRILKSDGCVWYHDGMETGRSMDYHGLANSFDWRMCRGKIPNIYVRFITTVFVDRLLFFVVLLLYQSSMTYVVT